MFDVDKLLQRQLWISKYSDTLSAQLIKEYGKGDRQLISAIRDFVDNASSRDIQGIQIGGIGSKLAQELLKEIDAIINAQRLAGVALFDAELLKLAKSEANSIALILGSAKVDPVVFPIRGVTPDRELSNIAVQQQKVIRQALAEAFGIDGNPVNAIRGTKDQNYRDGVLNARNRNLTQNAHYLPQGVAQSVRTQAYKTVKVRRVEWLATLDGRVCKYCAANEANSPYKINKAPTAPNHPRCRCVVIPMGDAEERPFVSDSRSVKDIPLNERKNKIGQTKAKFPEWFDRQPAAFQREWLGVERYELYRTGKIELADLVRGDPARIVRIEDLV